MIIELDDADDARLDDYRKLNDQPARRTLEGDEFFIAEGFVALDRVIDSGHVLRSVVATPSRVQRLLDRQPALDDGDVPLYVVDREVLASVIGFDLHRGIVAAARRRHVASVDDVVSGPARRIAVLEGLNDAENVGVIARAARALRVDAMILDPTCSDPYARRTVRVSMGEVLHLTVARAVDWPGELEYLRAAGIETWDLTPARDAENVWQAAHRGPGRLALALGAEGPGLSDAVLRAADRRVRIPISPDVDSLNVGHAAAIAFAATSENNEPPPPDQ